MIEEKRLSTTQLAKLRGMAQEQLFSQLSSQGLSRRKTINSKIDGCWHEVRGASTKPVSMGNMMELNGISCLALEEIAPAKQQIVCSRSFSRRPYQRVFPHQSVQSERAAIPKDGRHHIAFYDIGHLRDRRRNRQPLTQRVIPRKLSLLEVRRAIGSHQASPDAGAN